MALALDNLGGTFWVEPKKKKGKAQRGYSIRAGSWPEAEAEARRLFGRGAIASLVHANPSGARGSYKGGGLDVGFEYSLADLAAVGAIGLGAVGMWVDGPLPFADLVAIPMMLGGFGYFGVKAAAPQLLPSVLTGKSRQNPNVPMWGLGVVAVAAGAGYWLWSRRLMPKEEAIRLAKEHVAQVGPFGFSTAAQWSAEKGADKGKVFWTVSVWEGPTVADFQVLQDGTVSRA